MSTSAQHTQQLTYPVSSPPSQLRRGRVHSDVFAGHTFPLATFYLFIVDIAEVAFERVLGGDTVCEVNDSELDLRLSFGGTGVDVGTGLGEAGLDGAAEGVADRSSLMGVVKLFWDDDVFLSFCSLSPLSYNMSRLMA